MLNTTAEYLNSFKTPSRQIAGSIKYIHEGVEYELLASGGLKSFTIERTSPNGKFFGFAVAQKITIEALGVYENIQKGDRLIPSVGIKDATTNVELPYFYVEEISFNKVNNTTTITGYDIIGRTNNLLIKDIKPTFPISLMDYAGLVVSALGGELEGFDAISYNLHSSPNFDGTEQLQAVLMAIGEASGSFCYVQSGDNVKFRMLKNTVFDTLTPSDYYNFSAGEETILTQIASATELGDNYTYGDEGFTQVIRENPFISLVDNISSILETIGLFLINLKNSFYQLDWRGCPAYELGDLIKITEKDGVVRYIYYLNETLIYNGGLKATSNWEPTASERVDGAPTSISKLVTKTSAKVDKVNQEIELLASRVEELDPGNITEEIASIKLTTDSITQEVSNFTSAVNETLGVIGNKVNSSITAEDATILIQETIGDGVTSITTETGYKFDKEGLTISKSGSEMETTITEDGMTVARSGIDVLTADNVGVVAINLHATTYLIIGGTSRLEDYYDSVTGKQMTGCFWIGE